VASVGHQLVRLLNPSSAVPPPCANLAPCRNDGGDKLGGARDREREDGRRRGNACTSMQTSTFRPSLLGL